MPGISHPFDKKDLARINAALDNLAPARKIIEKAKLAGFDVESKCADCDTIEDRLKAIKEHFYSIKPE